MQSTSILESFPFVHRAHHRIHNTSPRRTHSCERWPQSSGAVASYSSHQPKRNVKWNTIASIQSEEMKLLWVFFQRPKIARVWNGKWINVRRVSRKWHEMNLNKHLSAIRRFLNSLSLSLSLFVHFDLLSHTSTATARHLSVKFRWSHRVHKIIAIVLTKQIDLVGVIGG